MKYQLKIMKPILYYFIFFLYFQSSSLFSQSNQKNNTELNQFYCQQIDSLYQRDKEVWSTRSMRQHNRYQRMKQNSSNNKTKRFISAQEAFNQFWTTSASNHSTLVSLIKEFGFPTLELVGPSSHISAITILEHSQTTEVAAQVVLDIFDTALSYKEIDPFLYADITDRIRANLGQKQLYYAADFCSFLDLSDEEKIKILERREKIGLSGFRFKCSTFGRWYYFDARTVNNKRGKNL